MALSSPSVRPASDDIVALSRRRRWRLVLAAALVTTLCTVAAWGVGQSLGTCHALDRLLGRSGCLARYRIDAFDLADYRALARAGDRALRVFGHDLGDHGQAVQVVVDLNTGRETSRELLPFGALDFTVQPSIGGATVSVACWSYDEACRALGAQGVVLDAATGAVLDEVRTDGSAAWLWEDERGGGLGQAAPWADSLGGGLGVAPDDATGGLTVFGSDGETVRSLAPPPGYEAGPAGPLLAAARASPSGRFVALISEYVQGHLERGGRLDIWDVEKGQLLRTTWLGASRYLETDAVWTADETRVIAMDDSSGTHVDLFVFAKP